MAQASLVPPQGRTGRARLVALAVLLLLPLSLRLTPVGHGLPTTTYVPDTHVVRGALGMAKEKSLVPPSGRYTSYPYLIPYLLLPIYGTQYAIGRASGEWAGAGEYGMRLLEEPARAHLPARILVALLGALTPFVILRTSRVMGLRAGAWVAAWLVATGLLHVHFSVQERPWVPLVFLLALSCWGASAHIVRGTPRPLLLSAVAAGLAFATHQGGLLAFGIPLLAWAFAPGAWSGARVRRGAVAAVVFCVLALLVGHPYLLVHGAPEASDVSGGLGGDIQVGGQGFSYRFRLASLGRMTKAFVGYDPAIVLLALAGLVPALRHRAAWPATMWALGWAAVFLTNFNDHVRYLLPLAVLLTPAAGFAAERLLAHKAGRPLLVLLLALPLVQSTRLGWLLTREDTRALAAVQLSELNLSTAIDVYGPDVPLDLASLERLRNWRELYSREEHRRLLLESGISPPDGAGLDVVRIADLFEFDMRTHSSKLRSGLRTLGEDPNAVLSGLGVTHILLVDRDPGDGVPPFLLDPTPPTNGAAKLAPLRIEEEALFTITPGESAHEARLPTELEFPLVNLWQVTRPGPSLALHRLREQG